MRQYCRGIKEALCHLHFVVLTVRHGPEDTLRTDQFFLAQLPRCSTLFLKAASDHRACTRPQLPLCVFQSPPAASRLICYFQGRVEGDCWVVRYSSAIDSRKIVIFKARPRDVIGISNFDVLCTMVFISALNQATEIETENQVCIDIGSFADRRKLLSYEQHSSASPQNTSTD